MLRPFGRLNEDDQRGVAMSNAEGPHTVRAFWDRPSAQAAVTELQAQGFLPDQIGYAARHDGESTEVDATTQAAEHTAEGAVKGLATGGVIGGLGAAAISLLIPGIGPIVGGGILATVLGGTVLGAGAGGLLGALTSLGLPAEEAHHYEREFRAGRPVVVVRAGGRDQDAVAILEQHGGYDPRTSSGPEGGAPSRR
jgi:hypothetical protein